MKWRLNRAFLAMRKNGLIARQNYLCCGGCAAYGLTEMAEARARRGRKILGAVSYHQQAATRFREGGELCITFGQVHSEALGALGVETSLVGAMVVAALEAEGLEPFWSGDENECITLDPAEHVVRMRYHRDLAAA